MISVSYTGLTMGKKNIYILIVIHTEVKVSMYKQTVQALQVFLTSSIVISELKEISKHCWYATENVKHETLEAFRWGNALKDR